MKKEHKARLALVDTIANLYYDEIGKENIVRALKSILVDIDNGGIMG